MLLLEVAFFHDCGDFGQRLLTACWPPVKFEIGNLERVIWTPFLPNIMVRDLILASGFQKKLIFCPQPTCWNNHLRLLQRTLIYIVAEENVVLVSTVLKKTSLETIWKIKAYRTLFTTFVTCGRWHTIIFMNIVQLFWHLYTISSNSSYDIYEYRPALRGTTL